MTEYKLFDRRYELEVNDGKEARVWTDLNVGFKITKTNEATPNEMELTFYNLGPDSRAFIYRKNLNVILKAGYRDSMGLVFRGNIEFINHEKQGTDWISRIYCKDGGAALRTLTIQKTFAKGTPLTRVIEDLIKKLGELPPGLAGQLQQINQLAQREIDVQGFKPKKPPVKQKKKTKAQPPQQSEAQQRDEYLKKKEDQRQKADDTKLQKALVLRGSAIEKLKILCETLGLVCHVTDQSLSVYPAGLAESTRVIDLDVSSGLIGSPERTENGGWKVMSLLRHELNPGMLVSVGSLYLDDVLLVQRVEHTGERSSGPWFSEIFCTEYQ
ncbi:MAG: hypothetical protein IGS03_00690 [Candidatus Sericytochromatia bacterium]|nr:hypothetical protein [Candidatus Sericytochromatia bacterium]